ncbi:pAbp, partial [Symbiodinium sp. KB8]
GKPCRVMWSQRDPERRRNTASNIFVKGLDPTIDNKALHDTFSVFGNILSCKVSTDNNGKSRGYGFVHYEAEEAAKIAIEKVNGMKIANSTVFVGPFIKREERGEETIVENYTNLYIKNMPPSWDDAKVAAFFAEFGE